MSILVDIVKIATDQQSLEESTKVIFDKTKSRFILSHSKAKQTAEKLPELGSPYQSFSGLRSRRTRAETLFDFFLLLLEKDESYPCCAKTCYGSGANIVFLLNEIIVFYH